MKSSPSFSFHRKSPSPERAAVARLQCLPSALFHPRTDPAETFASRFAEEDSKPRVAPGLNAGPKTWPRNPEHRAPTAATATWVARAGQPGDILEMDEGDHGAQGADPTWGPLH